MSVEIQLWPCDTIMANGWYVLDNMTWFLTRWLITSGVGNWGVTVGIRARFMVCVIGSVRVVWSTGSIRNMVDTFKIVVSEAEWILVLF